MPRRRALPVLPPALRTAPPDPAGWAAYDAADFHDWTPVKTWGALRDALAALAAHRDALRTAIAAHEAAGGAPAAVTPALAEQRQHLLVACAKLEALRWAIGDTEA